VGGFGEPFTGELTMTTAFSAQSRRSVAVTLVGIITLILAGPYAALGSWLLYAAESNDLSVRFIRLITMIPLGIVFLIKAVVMILAGLGVLRRRQWALVLTLCLAGLAIMIYLTALSNIAIIFTQPDFPIAGLAFPIAIAVGQVLYALFAFIVLIKNGAEFSHGKALVNSDAAPVAPAGRPRD
jgi:hypothetical protein